MPANETGNPANGHRSPAIVLSVPVDADARNAASVQVPFQTAADFIAWLQLHTAILDDTNTYTAANWFRRSAQFDGAAGDDLPSQSFGAVPTTRKLAHDWTLAMSPAPRTYARLGGAFEITANAIWNASGPNANKWTRDLGGVDSWRLVVDPQAGGGVIVQVARHAAVAAPFVDGAWVTIFSTRGTPHDGSEYAVSAGWGAGCHILPPTATDKGGILIVQATGGGEGVDPTVTITFKDGAWPAGQIPVSMVKCWLGEVEQPLYWFTTSTQLVIKFKGTPLDANNYSFTWLVQA